MSESPGTSPRGEVHFLIEHALEYGLDEAIVLYKVADWATYNAANEQNAVDGRYWTYNTIPAWQHHFPWLPERTLRRVLKSLESQGAVLTGRHAADATDRTKWYSPSDASIHLARGHRYFSQITHAARMDGWNRPKRTLLTSGQSGRMEAAKVAGSSIHSLQSDTPSTNESTSPGGSLTREGAKYELIRAGVSMAVAKRLAAKFSPRLIARHIHAFQIREPKPTPGWLVKAIEEDFQHS